MEKGLGLSRVFALFALIILSACDYRPAQDTDAQFKEQVLEIMPGFALTEELYGRPVIRANGYGQEALLVPSNEIIPIVEAFFSQFEETGLRSFEFGFSRVIPEGVEYNSIDFPGCTPGTCVETSLAQPLKRLTRDEYFKIRQPGPHGDLIRFDFLRERLNGMQYRAQISAIINEFGETQKYSVILYREPLTARERRYARRFPAAPRDPASIRVFLYTNNLALGIDAETDEPVSNHPINLSMGL